MNLNKIFLIFIIFIYSFTLFSSNKNITNKINKAKKYFYKGENNKAKPIFNELLKFSIKNNKIEPAYETITYHIFSPNNTTNNLVEILNQVISTLKNYSTQPKLLVKKLNEILYDKIKGRFITAGYMLVDLSKNQLIYANAGHPPIYVYKNDTNSVGEFLGQGILIGYKNLDLNNYNEIKVDIKKGDKIILYTDGVTEALNRNKEMFGEKRFKKIIKENSQKNIQDISDTIYNNLISWIKDDKSTKILNDDMTLIGIEIKK